MIGFLFMGSYASFPNKRPHPTFMIFCNKRLPLLNAPYFKRPTPKGVFNRIKYVQGLYREKN